MIAEVIALGSELTSGQKLDTNSQWLSVELGRVGIPVHYHTTVADGLEAMIDLFRTAAGRSDLVLITGGLGPTLDDLTREAMAGVAGSQLILHSESLDIIREMFERRGREMPERNAIQAMFPEGSEVLPNPRGTAPGIWLPVRVAGRPRPSVLAALPGVPSEMKPMFEQQVLPRLPAGQRVIRHARIHCFGQGESQIEQLLGELTARGRDPEVGITAHEGTITLRITAVGGSDRECDQKITDTAAVIRATLGELVFGEEDEELEDVLVTMLSRTGATLASVEIGGSAHLSQRLSRVDPWGRTFRGGLVVADLDHLPKAVRQGVGESGTADEPRRREVLQLVGRQVRQLFSADYVLATWIPSEVADLPEQQAVVVLDGVNFEYGQTIAAVGDLSIHHSRTAKVAKNLLRRHLQQTLET